jgi:hypothetical protein
MVADGVHTVQEPVMGREVAKMLTKFNEHH